MNQKELARNFLGLNTNKDSFVIGELDTIGYADICIEITNRYYDHCKKIHDDTEQELNKNDDLIDYSFKCQILKEIKLRFFPRYLEFQALFNKQDHYTNDYLSELHYWAKSEEHRNEGIKGHKLSKELYCRLIMHYAPPKLKAIIDKKIPISLATEDINSHSFIVSKTDTGKSSLILELAKNIIDKGESSLVILEPHGDLAKSIAKLTKSENLVYLDPLVNSDFAPTINIFDIKNINANNLSIYTSLIVNTFKQIIGAEFSVNMHSLITPVIAVLLQIPDTSFYDMLKFLDDKQNKDLLEFGKNNTLIASHRLFFQKQFSETRYSATKFSIASKLNILLQDSVFSNLLTGKSTFNLEELINTKGKVIVILLNTISMIETIEPIGRFLIALIVSYAFQRANIDIKDRISCNLFIDEGSMFIGDSIELILSQARKFRLFLLIAIQNNSQFPTSVLSSVLSNTHLKFVGINSHKNHSIMSNEIGVSIDDLNTLKLKGQFYLKIGTNKAFKFRVSSRLFNKDLYHSNYEFTQIVKEQLNKYYRKVDLTDIHYANIPKVKNVESQEENKIYSKQSTDKLLLELSSKKSDNIELLEY